MLDRITEMDLAAARSGHAAAVARLFREATEPCARIITTIVGRRDVAAAVVKELHVRAARQIEKWSTVEEASRWFMHHTIILIREYRKPIDSSNDVLLHEVGGPDVVQYQALVGAIRKLPDQQQEAFLLTYAHRWNVRYCSIAMDCSTKAVETHLTEARRQVQPLCGESFDALTGFLHQVHKSIPLELPDAPKIIAAKIVARRSFRTLTTIAGWLLILLIVTAIVAAVVILGPRIET